MLLTEKAKLNINIESIDLEFKFDFRTIENLYYALKEELICRRINIFKKITPLDLLEEMEEYNESYLILMLHATSNAIYTIEEIEILLKELDIKEKLDIYLILKNIVIHSLIFIDKQEEKDNNTVEEKSIKIDFEKWFNHYFVMAIDKLKMSLDEFYNSTPAQIKERVHRVNVDKKNRYISAYCEIIDAKVNTENNSKLKKVEEVSDVWAFMRRI